MGQFCRLFVFAASFGLLVPVASGAQNAIAQTMKKINAPNCSIYAHIGYKAQVIGVGVMSSDKSTREALMTAVDDPRLAENCASDVADNFCDSEFLAFASSGVTTGVPISPGGQAFHGILTLAGIDSADQRGSGSNLVAPGLGLLGGGIAGNKLTDGSVLGTLGGAALGLGAGVMYNTHQTLTVCRETQAQFSLLSGMLLSKNLKVQKNKALFLQEIVQKAEELDKDRGAAGQFASKPSDVAALMIDAMTGTVNRLN